MNRNVWFSGTAAFEIPCRGRIEAFLVQENWSDSIAGREGEKGLHHGRPFGHVFGGFISQQTQFGAALLSEIIQIIASMMVDGSWGRILVKYPQINSLFAPLYRKTGV